MLQWNACSAFEKAERNSAHFNHLGRDSADFFCAFSQAVCALHPHLLNTFLAAPLTACLSNFHGSQLHNYPLCVHRSVGRILANITIYSTAYPENIGIFTWHSGGTLEVAHTGYIVYWPLHTPPVFAVLFTLENLCAIVDVQFFRNILYFKTFCHRGLDTSILWHENL